MTVHRSPDDRLPTRMLLILALGTFVVGTDGFVLNGLLLPIAEDLQVSESAAGQLTTVFAFTYAVASPLLAAATGDWDRRWLFGGGLAVFTLGMAGQAFGPGYTVVLVSRGVAAIGAAACQSNAYVVAGALATGARRGRALATVAAGMSASMVLGVPIGVLLGQWLGWRAVLCGIGVAGALLTLLTPVLPAVRVPPVGLRVRLSVFARPGVATVLLVTVLGTLALYAVLVYLPVVAQPSATGATLSWVLVAFGAGHFTGNSLAGRWTDRFGPDRVVLASLAGCVTGFAALNLARLSLPGTLLFAGAIGVAAGMLMVPQQHRLFSAAPDSPTVALGLNGSMIYLGAGAGSAIGGVVLATAGVGWLPAAGVVLAALGLGLAAANRRSPVPR
ncbi:MFS transporter [Crossiella sp. SN42]|uniref:MFS transporter n=1 Tax=Crossiella sp. SN42 TaxID=2944808 RepID=UPI00207D6FFA|nr:MFS transporter [Crossiella sp. SN42]MCO1580450.1 MFS transporter [Crossiella sp. SN42]